MAVSGSAGHIRPRPSNLGLVLLVALTAAALLLVVRLMLGEGFAFTLGGLRLRVHDYVRPLGIAVLSASVLLYLGRLTSWARRTALALLAVSGVLGLVAIARGAMPIVPEGDMAVLESYTIFASQGDLFVGPYSRFGWNHPGPLYFYLLVPFHVLSGQLSASLWSGALAINLLAILGMFWVVMRMEAPHFAVALAAALARYLWSVGEFLPSPWNPHVLVLPLMATIVLAASVATGVFRLLPLMAVLATLVAQTHVGLVPTVFAVCALATGAGLWRELATQNGSGWKPTRRVLHITCWTLFVLWSLPLAEQVHARSGNLTELWAFFTAGAREGEPFQSAFIAWAELLTGVLHRWLRVGWGVEYVAREAMSLRVIAVAEVVLLLGLAVFHDRHRRAFMGALCGLLVLASVLACWSVTRVEEGIKDHAIFWISGLGALNVAAILEAVVRIATLRVRMPAIRHAAIAAGALTWSLSTVLGLQYLEQRVERTAAPILEERRAHYFVSEVITYLQQHPDTKPLIRIDQDAWRFVAGAVVQLQKEDRPFAVERAWEAMFTEATLPNGDENAVIVYAQQPHYDEIMKEHQWTVLAAYEGTFIVASSTRDQ